MRQLKIAKRPVASGMAGRITPQQKIINVANKLGNVQAKNQQGTTVILYDSLPLDGRTTYRFFEGAGARTFPFTNMDNNSGKLGVGDTMVMRSMQILFFTLDAVTGAITAIAPLNTNLNFQQGELSILQANQQILKRMKVQNMTDFYNKSSMIDDNNVFRFETELSLQSLMDFYVEIRLPAGTTTANTFAQIIIEGNGGILAPKVNF